MAEKTRVLLIKPFPERKIYSIAPPMGLLYLSSYVRMKNPGKYDFRLLDMRQEKAPFFELRSILKEFRPDVVGFSACTEDHANMVKAADTIKSHDSSILIAAGGPHPTMYTRDVLSAESIDIVVRGEGEETFYEILEKQRSGTGLRNITGTSYMESGKYIFQEDRPLIEDLDSIPFPDWELMDIKSYSRPGILNMNALLAGKRYMGIVTSRGCPYSCAYCHNMFGRKYRTRSSENVFNEIKILREKYGIDEIHVYDDIFNLDRTRMHEICDMLISSGTGIRIAFPNGLRGDILTKKDLLKLKRAGVYMVTFALETASGRLQRSIGKNLNIDRLRENIEYSSRIGLLTKCYFMLGFPGEKHGEIMKTVKFALRSPLDFASFFAVTPQKNTRLYNMAVETYPGLRLEFTEAQYYSGKKVYERLLGLGIRNIQKKAYRRFYLSPLRMYNIFRKVPRRIFIFSNMLKFITFFR